VYRTDIHPFAFLPHSVKWQTVALALVLAGTVTNIVSNHAWAAGLLLGAGAIGLAATIAKNISYAVRSNVDALPGSRLWSRAVVAYLHFIPPFARITGQIRGILSPPQVAMPVARRQTSRGPRPTLREAMRAVAALGRRRRGSLPERKLTSIGGSSASSPTGCAGRAVRAIEIDEGGRTTATSACRRPLGVDRHPCARRGSRRRQGAAARRHPSPADDLRRAAALLIGGRSAAALTGVAPVAIAGIAAAAAWLWSPSSAWTAQRPPSCAATGQVPPPGMTPMGPVWPGSAGRAVGAADHSRAARWCSWS
jgi:hypothetical protein